MIKTFLRKIRQARNFWFFASFDEIRILYLAKLLRSLAVNLTSGFVLMYFYKVGYGWSGVLGFLAFSYVIKLISVWFAGSYIAKHGPKHGLLLSNILHIPMLIGVSLVCQFGVWMAIVVMIIQGVAISMHNISHYVDFSKVKSVKKTGRQLSLMYIIEKAAAMLAPLAGGWIVICFGAEVAMLIAASLFALSAIPLLSTREVMKSDIKLNYRKIQVDRLFMPILLPQTFSAAPSSTIHFIWGIFVPIFIFSKDNPYGVMSVLASLSAIGSIISMIILGKLVDKRFGGKMLRLSLVLRGFIEIFRGAIVNSALGVVVSRLLDDLAGSGYMLSNQKGLAFEADESGARIEFFVISETFFFAGSLIYSLLAWLLCFSFGAELGIRIFMVLSGIMLLLFGRIRYSVFEK